MKKLNVSGRIRSPLITITLIWICLPTVRNVVSSMGHHSIKKCPMFIFLPPSQFAPDIFRRVRSGINDVIHLTGKRLESTVEFFHPSSTVWNDEMNILFLRMQMMPDILVRVFYGKRLPFFFAF